MDLPWLDKVVWAKRPARLPEVLTRSEVNAVLARMEGAHGLMAQMLYGKGMRFICRVCWSGSVRMRPRGGVTP